MHRHNHSINLDRIWRGTIPKTRDKNVILWSIETTFKFKHIFILYPYTHIHIICYSFIPFPFPYKYSFLFVVNSFHEWHATTFLRALKYLYHHTQKMWTEKNSKWNTLNLGNFTHLKEMGDIYILSLCCCCCCWYVVGFITYS